MSKMGSMVLEVQEAWSNGLGVVQVAELVGVPVSMVEDIVQEMLDQERRGE